MIVLRKVRCPNCGAPLNDRKRLECPDCMREVPESVRKKIPPGIENVPRRRGSAIPWGLLIILGLYFGGTYAYARYRFETSKEYVAAQHLRAAAESLGRDEGRTAKQEALQVALDHLLAALNIFPDDPWAHKQLQSVVQMLSDRGFPISTEMQHRVDALARRYREIKEGKRSALVVGPRDIWNLDELASAPGRAMRDSVFGAALIVFLWFIVTLKDRRYADQMAAEREDERRKELAELRRPKSQR